MLANAMFYGTETSDANAFQFGPFALTSEQVKSFPIKISDIVSAVDVSCIKVLVLFLPWIKNHLFSNPLPCFTYT